MDRIELVRAQLLRLPLAKPYKLVFGDVTAFDTLLVTVTTGTGAVGVGEATILTGYTEETVTQCWTVAREIGPLLAGLDGNQALARLQRWQTSKPFTATAFATAIEAALGDPLLRPGACRVPLLAILNATEPGAIETELETLLVAGYRTIKVKVGWVVEDDLARVRRVQATLGGRAAIRVDANQGYSVEDACRFVDALDPGAIELFEQPCAAGDWDAAVAVRRRSPVPLMLDESIYSTAEIERAAELGAADVIKLKLMKMGGLGALRASLARIVELGMKPVLGNGVASDIGCWMEACVAADCLDNAGEMNGFLKQRTGLLLEPMTVRAGAIELPANFAPTLNPDAVAAACVAEQLDRLGGKIARHG